MSDGTIAEAQSSAVPPPPATPLPKPAASADVAPSYAKRVAFVVLAMVLLLLLAAPPSAVAGPTVPQSQPVTGPPVVAKTVSQTAFGASTREEADSAMAAATPQSVLLADSQSTTLPVDPTNDGGAVDVESLHRRLHDAGYGAPQCAINMFSAAFEKYFANVSEGILGPQAAYCKQRSTAPTTATPLVVPLFIVHYSPASARRRHVENVLTAHGLQPDRSHVAPGGWGVPLRPVEYRFAPIWITAFDREELTKPMTGCLHQPWVPPSSGPPPQHRSDASAQRKAQRHAKRPFERLKASQVSVVTKHHFAMYAATRWGCDWSVVLEDDVLLRYRFGERLAQLFDGDASFKAPTAAARSPQVAAGEPSPSGGALLTGYPKVAAPSSRRPRPPFNFLVVGGCLRMRAWRAKFKATQITPHLWARAEARCAHAYAVANGAARSFLQSLPLTLPIDFQLSAAMNELAAPGGPHGAALAFGGGDDVVRAAWVEPWLSVQTDVRDGCVTNGLGAGARCITIDKDSRDPIYQATPAADVVARDDWDRASVPVATPSPSPL